jgi:hypothetical protein
MAARCGLVQVIQVRWTKAARGGEGARTRSAVPSALAVPAAELADAEGMLCVEISQWDERDYFAEPHSVRRHRTSLADGYSFGCVSISAAAKALLARYQYDRGSGGAPDAWFFNGASGYGESPGHTLHVRYGEWARICYNGRFSSPETGDWWYQQITVNVALFAREADGGVFLDRAPTQQMHVLRDLW